MEWSMQKAQKSAKIQNVEKAHREADSAHYSTSSISIKTCNIFGIQLGLIPGHGLIPDSQVWGLWVGRWRYQTYEFGVWF